MRPWLMAGVAALAIALPWASAAEPDRSKDLTEAVRIEADGKPINIGGVGHSAPFVGDIDGDGKFDLLVGTFTDGSLRIYRNVGTNKEPKFGKFELLMTEGVQAKVPTG